MKKIVLTCGLLISISTFGADWKYVAMGGENDRAIYVDNSQYMYNKKNNTVKAWFKTVSYMDTEGSDTYIKSKNFYQFSCSDKKIKLLGYVNYDKNAAITSTDQRDEKEAKYNLVIPDTIGEDLWKASCLSEGNGFRLPKLQAGERLSKEEMDKAFPKGYLPKKLSQDETEEMSKNLSPQ
ncbi:surface-adhesin E family protein [Acinetobacter nosocomialis]|uniref:surface-adhesin E family protein n=1 Tax=Acinetobacter nosocomialis TaxID=106654 RepID=UPI0034623CFF